MPKEIIQIIEDQFTVNGEAITVRAGEVVRATPADGSGPEYIRLQFTDGTSYKWSAPVADWNENVTESDPRWVAEN